MNSIDLTSFYRSSVGFDRIGSLIDNALSSDTATSYPPFNIEVLGENEYAITLAVAGFSENELGIKVEQGVLVVRGEKSKSEKREYIHQGIASQKFERRYNLAEYVEVTEAELQNGLLTIHLLREIPETMKPRKISINQGTGFLEHKVPKKTDKKTPEKHIQ